MRAAAAAQLKSFGQEGQPKPLIESLGESLLATFHQAPLLDPYDLYQHLLDYWAATMQDDCYLIAADGWQRAAQPRLLVEDKNKKSKAKPDLVLGKQKYLCELIPPSLVIARYFGAEQRAIDALETQIATLQQTMEELAEEQGGEEGLLAEGLNDKGNLTASRRGRLIWEIGRDPDGAEERAALDAYLALVEQEASAAGQLKAAQDALTAQVVTKYPALSEDEIKTLVVEDKWLATIAAAVQGELDRVSQTLTGRIRQLAERYATPLPKLIDEVDALAARVDEHLEKMGATWN
mgnify:CR=1 FL=1